MGDMGELSAHVRLRDQLAPAQLGLWSWRCFLRNIKPAVKLSQGQATTRGSMGGGCRTRFGSQPGATMSDRRACPFPSGAVEAGCGEAPGAKGPVIHGAAFVKPAPGGTECRQSAPAMWPGPPRKAGSLPRAGREQGSFSLMSTSKHKVCLRAERRVFYTARRLVTDQFVSMVSSCPAAVSLCPAPSGRGSCLILLVFLLACPGRDSRVLQRWLLLLG